MTCCRSSKGPYIHLAPHGTAGPDPRRMGQLENNRRARLYSLTRAGQNRLGQELEQ